MVAGRATLPARCRVTPATDASRCESAGPGALLWRSGLGAGVAPVRPLPSFSYRSVVAPQPAGAVPRAPPACAPRARGRRDSAWALHRV